jgi:hypothetical protein
MLYTLICNAMRKEVKSIWWDQWGECWIDLSTNGPNRPLGLWLASRSGTPRLLQGWWAPVVQHYKREWGVTGSDNEVRHRHCSTPLRTLTNLEGRAEATGSKTAPPQIVVAVVPALHCASLPQRRAPSTEPVKEQGLEVCHLVFIPLDLLLIDLANLSLSTLLRFFNLAVMTITTSEWGTVTTRLGKNRTIT